MDSAKAKGTNGLTIARAVAQRAVSMIKPELERVAILGYYLLTDDLDARSPNATATKVRLYRGQAQNMHKALMHKPQHLTHFSVQGGAAWVMSEKPYSTYEQFALLEQELAKQMEAVLC